MGICKNLETLKSLAEQRAKELEAILEKMSKGNFNHNQVWFAHSIYTTNIEIINAIEAKRLENVH